MLRNLALFSRRGQIPSSCSFGTPSSLNLARYFSEISKIRNIGISAHIDSGKTTLTERILFYSGRIHEIHDVRGKTGVGAKMDSMELEREKGITIQSAATYTSWNDHNINIIDTPGHVDFTIEVERALRVLDGAIMVLCGVSGVQSQSITVDRQMKRYDVPRLCFINKLDRLGASPWKPIANLKNMLNLNAAAVQLPIGEDSAFEGLVCLLTGKSTYFDGDNGEILRVVDAIPEGMEDLYEEKRALLIETLADADEEIGELFLLEEEPTVEQLKAAIRRSTLALKFTPVYMGSAFKNKGVQLVLDAVVEYLPNPSEVINKALDQDNNEAEVVLTSDATKPLVGLAFKLEEGRFGQLTYLRIYQGTLTKGDQVMNVNEEKRSKVPRLVRMHSDEMEDVNCAKAGEIVALFGIECNSGSTFVKAAKGQPNYTMTSMYVPKPVISLAVKPKAAGQMGGNFSKAMSRFRREDPTFHVSFNDESQETVIAGMGELHLEVYVERLKREYGVECIVGPPQVNYRETIGQHAKFDYTHKKQSGGSGQYGRIAGYLEPLEEGDARDCVIENRLVGNNVPPEFVPALYKGIEEAMTEGRLTGSPVTGVRVVLVEGQAHPVDSNELAFRLATKNGFYQAFMKASPQLLQPIMDVTVEVPVEFQGAVVSQINRRRGMIDTVENNDGLYCAVKSQVPLSCMFGYSTDLRSATEGKGEFSMEYREHFPVNRDEQDQLVVKYNEKQKEKKQEDSQGI